ncbi:MAG TPA: glycosyltransferase family 2 protein [Stellaceae bacterium]|nr:glycosyltransferase family 2 protein [Stellaceae bacterium]
MKVLDRIAVAQQGIASLSPLRTSQIAVLIPCYDEERAIGSVVARFRAALPDARIYVYDNNSRDRTAALAHAAGAVVRHERLQGKGNVVARMFADIDADVYVLVDGDDTYCAAAAADLIAHLLEHRLDLVNGLRVGAHQRRGHRLGNTLFNRIVGRVFGSRFDDMLSGYKVLSRRFVKSFPALANGFEIETELTVHALRLRMPVAELPTDYGSRPTGSLSKLHTIRDGVRILRAIALLIKGERPLAFFSVVFAVLAASSLALATPVAVTFFESGLVPRLPTAVLAASVMLLAFLSLACGFVLDTVTRGRIEMKRLHYLSLPAPGETGTR